MAIRTLTLLTLTVLAVGVFAGVTSADDGTAGDVGDPAFVGAPPPCGTTGVATLSGVDCIGIDPVPSLDGESGGSTRASSSPAFDPGLPPSCRVHLEAVFYTEEDWLRLGQKLAADPSPCADYYISIPTLAADHTKFRVLQDDLIRALGPRF